jgi:hypothetical protein
MIPTDSTETPVPCCRNASYIGPMLPSALFRVLPGCCLHGHTGDAAKESVDRLTATEWEISHNFKGEATDWMGGRACAQLHECCSCLIGWVFPILRFGVDISHRHECAEVPLAGMTAARYFGMCTCSFMYSQNPRWLRGTQEWLATASGSEMFPCGTRLCGGALFVTVIVFVSGEKYIMGEYCTFSYRLLQEPPMIHERRLLH